FNSSSISSILLSDKYLLLRFALVYISSASTILILFFIISDLFLLTTIIAIGIAVLINKFEVRLITDSTKSNSIIFFRISASFPPLKRAPWATINSALPSFSNELIPLLMNAQSARDLGA